MSCPPPFDREPQILHYLRTLRWCQKIAFKVSSGKYYPYTIYRAASPPPSKYNSDA